MCAIVDANVAHQVFDNDPPPAGRRFYDWLNEGKGLLVVGGLLFDELQGSSPGFRAWAQQAQNSGRLQTVDNQAIAIRAEELRDEGRCRSNDYHVIALAQISGARLLYTNDRQLQNDFGDAGLVSNPRGRVYTTVDRTDVRDSHRNLLTRTDLCQASR